MPTGSPKISERDKAFIRLKCVELILANGNRLDANKNLLERSDEYFQYITGRKKAVPTVKPTPIVQVKETPIAPPEDTASQSADKNPDSNPFGDSGRQKVLI